MGSLREELAENSGITPWSFSWFTNWLENMFGEWGTWFVKMGMNLLIILIVIGLTVCCFIPSIRGLCVFATVKQMSIQVSSSETEEKRQLIGIYMQESSQRNGWGISQIYKSFFPCSS